MYNVGSVYMPIPSRFGPFGCSREPGALVNRCLSDRKGLHQWPMDCLSRSSAGRFYKDVPGFGGPMNTHKLNRRTRES